MRWEVKPYRRDCTEFWQLRHTGNERLVRNMGRSRLPQGWCVDQQHLLCG